MPHDKHKKEAKVGDYVKFKDHDGEVHIGRVEVIYPHEGGCNATVSHVIHVPQAVMKSVTLAGAEIVHQKEYMEDLEADAKG